MTEENGNQDAAEKAVAEKQAFFEKCARRMVAVVEHGKCARCERVHPAPRLRWKCGGCEDEVCWNAVQDGTDYGRKGQDVHALISANPDKPNASRVCGVLTAIAEPLPKEPEGDTAPAP